MTSSPTLLPGTRIGPYVLGKPVGAGVSATVYRAYDAEKRPFAIKIRRTGVAQLDRRFLREFESMRALRVPGVVRVHEAGIEDELLWFSMDLIAGKPFVDALLVWGDVATRAKKVVDAGRQLLEVLGGLHQAGYVHRDVKPSNVLVDDEGRVTVLDFGIARFFGDQDTLSDSGQVLGTVPFMSPEQLAGLPIDHGIDLWAAGVMLYEAVDGPRPRPQTAVGWIPRICLERLVPLAVKHPQVPRGLSHVVDQLLRLDSRDRPSGADAAAILRRVADRDTLDQPEPTWVDTGEWLAEVEGAIGNSRFPAVQILEGPPGAGKRRVAEQISRQAVMQGVWPLHVRAQIDGLGEPLADLLDRVLASADEVMAEPDVVEKDGEVLRRMWPRLEIPGAVGAGAPPEAAEVAGAFVRCMSRAAKKRPMLVVVHQLEQLDPLTVRGLALLAAEAGPQLGLLLLHDPRWEAPQARHLLGELRARGAAWHALPALTDAQAASIAATLCPARPPAAKGARTAQAAVEIGLAALAAARGELWSPPRSSLWPLVVRSRNVPEPVFVRLSGAGALDDPWVRRGDGTVSIDVEFARTAVKCTMPDPRESTRKLEEAWSAELGNTVRPGEVARLRLLGADPGAAWEPALEAAIAAESNGRFADARRWLLLAESLPAREGQRTFDVAVLRARVAMRTEAGPPRAELVDVAERAAPPGSEAEMVVRALRAEYQLRSGEVRPALVSALRVASQVQQTLPFLSVRALLVATHARYRLAQYTEAGPQLERAAALLEAHPEPHLEVQVANAKAELLYRQGQFQDCRALLQRAIRLAGETGYVRGTAFAASRLAQVLRVLGRRREAEHHIRTAREAFQETSDLLLEAETGLELAMLRAERGDAAGARALLDDAVKRIRGCGLATPVGAAKVALQIATLRAESAEASVALAQLESAGDPEAPPFVVRWWRTRGDLDHAMRVAAPPPDTWGHVLWRIERARAALAAGHPELAFDDADRALDTAMQLGLQELALYARLVVATLRPTDAATWRELQEEASAALYVEVYLGALEMEARKLAASGDAENARARWRALRARSEELGYRPGVEEATGWLQAEKS